MPGPAITPGLFASKKKSLLRKKAVRKDRFEKEAT
jgi:hypothetical protein